MGNGRLRCAPGKRKLRWYSPAKRIDQERRPYGDQTMAMTLLRSRTTRYGPPHHSRTAPALLVGLATAPAEETARGAGAGDAAEEGGGAGPRDTAEAAARTGGPSPARYHVSGEGWVKRPTRRGSRRATGNDTVPGPQIPALLQKAGAGRLGPVAARLGPNPSESATTLSYPRMSKG